MHEIINKADQYIFELKKKTCVLNELIEFKNSLLIPGLNSCTEISNDISIGIATSNYPFGKDGERPIQRFHTVELEQDLGITGLQKTFRAMLLHDVETRIEEVEKEIQEKIGGEDGWT